MSGRLLTLYAFQVVRESDIVFVAVKPQYVAPVLKEVRSYLTENHTIVSIAAGKTLSSLKVRPSASSVLHRWSCFNLAQHS
jgi:pyrroline-5-carboxylate reductase